MFDMTPADRERIVAKMLGYDPEAQETWPMETIHQILRAAERAANASVGEDVAKRLNGASRKQ